MSIIEKEAERARIALERERESRYRWVLQKELARAELLLARTRIREQGCTFRQKYQTAVMLKGQIAAYEALIAAIRSVVDKSNG